LNKLHQTFQAIRTSERYCRTTVFSFKLLWLSCGITSAVLSSSYRIRNPDARRHLLQPWFNLPKTSFTSCLPDNFTWLLPVIQL